MSKTDLPRVTLASVHMGAKLPASIDLDELEELLSSAKREAPVDLHDTLEATIHLHRHEAPMVDYAELRITRAMTAAELRHHQSMKRRVAGLPEPEPDTCATIISLSSHRSPLKEAAL